MNHLSVGGNHLSDFTGRSSFTAMKKANEARQSEIHLVMAELIASSKVRGSTFCLQIHRPPSGNWRLRWRVKRGTSFSHVLWPDLAKELAGLPIAIQKHYETLNRRAEEADHLDIMVQHTIKWCAIYLGQQSSRTKPGSDAV